MTSPSFFDRLTSPRTRTPILPLHKSATRSPGEYQLNRLDPRPDDVSSLDDDPPTAWLAEHDVLGTPRGSSPSSWRDKSSPAASSSKMRPKPMFAGPPPPIASSMMMMRSDPSPHASISGRGNSIPQSQSGVGSVLFDHSHEVASHRPDSLWRGLRRREKALEKEVQQLLDVQANALVAGSGHSGTPSDNDDDVYSDTGSSTPTGTFYSTKSSKSRMTGSLYVPPRATADGNVIPVRQPANDRPRGLRAARAALHKSITAMARLKQEENTHLEAALSQRKEALAYLDRLNAKRVDIHTQLLSLDEDGDEPLGKELRELDATHDALNEEIRLLEEKLVGMRNRRRWLREKMGDIKNRREAGLSGYRGALKDVDSEVTELVRRPPIQPLDPEMLDQNGEANGELGSTGGLEFLRLIPERRTIDMAKSWWESEIAALERRKERIDADQQALEEGGAVWEIVIQSVTDFESNLRQLMKAGVSSPSSSSSASSSLKGKEKVPSQEELIRNQLPRMRTVVEELEQYVQLAEEKHWNLLICAIGAELEAFKEAHAMLESLVGASEDSPAKSVESLHGGTSAKDLLEQQDHTYTEESDNEVPPDLLASHVEDQNHEHESLTGPGDGAPLQRYDSEDEVPPEFLAEHGHGVSS